MERAGPELTHLGQSKPTQLSVGLLCAFYLEEGLGLKGLSKKV